MPRIIPHYRKALSYELMRQIRKAKGLGPNYIRAVDRLAKLDRLYDVDLTKPFQQPHKESEVVLGDIDADALEDKALLDEFNKRHYGRGNVRTETGSTDATTTDQHTDTAGLPE